MMKEKPRFYCGTCGREVPVNVEECPYCGMQFYGVMCPRCGKNGPANDFINGCPRCGYRSIKGGTVSTSNVPVLGLKDIDIDQDMPPKKRRKSIWLPLLVIILLGIIGAAIIFILLT